MSISLSTSFLIFIAGGVGANLRWLLDVLLRNNTGKIWMGTLAANLIGCLIFFLISRFEPTGKEMEFILKTGMLGSLTTFSTFSYEVVSLFKAGQATEALLVLFLNVFFGIIIGIGIIR